VEQNAVGFDDLNLDGKLGKSKSFLQVVMKKLRIFNITYISETSP
jgi:hypothetical protein